MEIRHHITLSVTEKSQAAEARRHAAKLAGILGLSRTDASNVAIMVTEIATNLAKHAVSGEMVLQELRHKAAVGIEILALDKGPGMTNIGQCLSDGYSSTGSPGTGIGAIQRLSNLFDILSVPELGTVTLVRYWTNSNVENELSSGLNVGVISVPKPGETICGDGWAIDDGHNHTKLLVVDGLGHGLLAADVSHAAIRAFHMNSDLGPSEILKAIHEALFGSRGAAVAITEIDQVSRIIRFAGVGNISGALLSLTGIKKMVSQSGIVGADIRKIQEFTYALPDKAILLMHSDGLQDRCNFDRYPGILTRHPSIIAGVFYRDHFRASDDATVLIGRLKT